MIEHAVDQGFYRVYLDDAVDIQLDRTSVSDIVMPKNTLRDGNHRFTWGIGMTCTSIAHPIGPTISSV